MNFLALPRSQEFPAIFSPDFELVLAVRPSCHGAHGLTVLLRGQARRTARQKFNAAKKERASRTDNWSPFVSRAASAHGHSDTLLMSLTPNVTSMQVGIAHAPSRQGKTAPRTEARIGHQDRVIRLQRRAMEAIDQLYLCRAQCRYQRPPARGGRIVTNSIP